MIQFVLALGLMLIALISISLRRTYYYLPAKELKRRARTDDPLAKVLYRAAAYGTSLGLLLWTIVALSLAASFVLLDQIVPSWLAFMLEAVVIGVGFAWIPTIQLNKTGTWLVRLLTPAVVWLLEILRPVLERITAFARDHHQVTVHTGLYEHDDLLELLERQKEQPNSRIPHEELDLLIHALTFGNKAVHECMVPRRVVRSISASESIGPLVIRELHDSGHSRFPVYDDKPDNIVGTLYLRDLVGLKHSGIVRNVMESSVYYVHEEYPLEQALHAFLKTKHHLFIVVNRFEEYVGIITIEDIIEQIIGCRIVDEFDAYDDMRAVAADHARHEHKERKKEHEEPPEVKTEPAAEKEKISEDTTEVVQ